MSEESANLLIKGQEVAERIAEMFAAGREMV